MADFSKFMLSIDTIWSLTYSKSSEDFSLISKVWSNLDAPVLIAYL